MSRPDAKRIGIIGARGYTGQELLGLLQSHPGFEIVFAGSRQLHGKPLSALAQGLGDELLFESIGPSDIAQRDFDALVLALPNGKSASFVQAVAELAEEKVILDLSADHRFDHSWHYGLPELTRKAAVGMVRIANPGCYATAMQLALAPIAAELSAPPCCFGVSGYSGAGTQPSERNDPTVLADNLLGYQPVNHVHEKEVSAQLGRQVRFMPHVAAFFRGIHLTVAVSLDAPIDKTALAEKYARFYEGEPLVQVVGDTPQVAANAGKHHAVVGGFGVHENGSHAVIYATLDNLLKGAATQALQNLNLAFGFAELEGIASG